MQEKNAKIICGDEKKCKNIHTKKDIRKYVKKYAKSATSRKFKVRKF